MEYQLFLDSKLQEHTRGQLFEIFYYNCRLITFENIWHKIHKLSCLLLLVKRRSCTVISRYNWFPGIDHIIMFKEYIFTVCKDVSLNGVAPYHFTITC